jgi:hypothetical protein
LALVVRDHDRDAVRQQPAIDCVLVVDSVAVRERIHLLRRRALVAEAARARNDDHQRSNAGGRQFRHEQRAGDGDRPPVDVGVLAPTEN